MSNKKFRLPRKVKKKIPKGRYCYKPLYLDKKLTFHIKSCEFFKYIKCKDKPKELHDEIDAEYPEERIGWCKLFKCEIDDQCKSCGIKY